MNMKKIVKTPKSTEVVRLLGLLILLAGISRYLYVLYQGTATQTDVLIALLFSAMSALYLYVSGMQKTS